MAAEAVTLHLHIHGRVQGVGYRAWMVQTARALALTGWVRNVSDGSVEAVVQGPRTVVATIVGLAHAGPPHARVSEVVTTAAPFHPDDGFHQLGIRHQRKNPV